MGFLRSIRSWIFGEGVATARRRPSRRCEERATEPPNTARRAKDNSQSAASRAETTSGVATGPPAPATEPASRASRRDRAVSADTKAAQARAAERLLEDESLRGDLTDDEFQPLLEWALEASDQLVARAEGLTGDEASEVVDAGLGQLRDVVRTAARAITAMLDDGPEARDAELRELAASIAPPLVPPATVDSSRMTLMAALDRVARDRSLAGSDLAQALAAALGRATANADGGDRGRRAAE